MLRAKPNSETSVIDHLGISISDPTVSRHFYDRALAPIGYAMLAQVPVEHTGGKAVLGYGIAPKADFWITEGEATKPHIHVAFRVESRRQVDEFYKAAMAAGGRDHGAPGERPHYQANYYGAFVLDPDGHNIEVVCHNPA